VVSGKGLQLTGADRRLQDLGIQLPVAPTPFGPYVETVQTGNLLFFSGMLPVVDHKPKYVGRLGKNSILRLDEMPPTPRLWAFSPRRKSIWAHSIE
jgi:hypothetical protein